LRLNFNFSSIWKIALRRNFRLPFVLIILLFVSFVRAVVFRPVDWGKIGVELAFVGAGVLIVLLNYHLSAAKYARAINKAYCTFVIDTQGLSRNQPNGTRTSIPWSAIPRWREGALVFTIGSTANYNVISKAALGHMPHAGRGTPIDSSRASPRQSKHRKPIRTIALKTGISVKTPSTHSYRMYGPPSDCKGKVGG